MSGPQVVGLDLSLTATGVAHGDGSTEVLLPREPRRAKGETRTIDLDIARLVWIRDTVIEACEAPLTGRPADLVVVEDYAPQAAAGSQAKIQAGELGGLVRVALTERGLPWVLVSTGTLKVYATGSGSSNKTAMALAAQKRAGLEFGGTKDDNRCDAWWLRALGLHALGHPVLQLPATHTRAVDAVDWRGHRVEVAT